MTTVMAIEAWMIEIINLSYGSPTRVNWMGATKTIRNKQTARTMAHIRVINTTREKRGNLM
ncbi:MAG: hypothetical protein M3297_13590 [Thermoproteota archaeon]|nr:hypothetical protein [Thermoproteota archaeon]